MVAVFLCQIIAANRQRFCGIISCAAYFRLWVGHMNHRRISLVWFLAFALVCAPQLAWALPSTPHSTEDISVVVDGSVGAMTVDSNDRIYIGQSSGGGIGRNSGGFPKIDAVTGAFDQTWPITNGWTAGLASDGSGGFYVGGDFEYIGNSVRTRLAHVQSDKTIGTLDVEVDGRVLTIIKSGNTLYIGGSFTTVGGQTRNRLASIDLTGNGGAGSVTDWDPNMGSSVNDMVLDGTTLYVGGGFQTVNGATTRNRVAAICTEADCDGAGTPAGTATAFNPVLSSTVNDLELDTVNDVLYVGGAFTCVGGDGDTTCGEAGEATRNRIASFTTADSAVVAGFDPNAGSTVHMMLLDGTTLYVVGAFTTIGGEARNRAAALCVTANCDGEATAEGAATAFDPNVEGGTASALALSGTSLYMTGAFLTVGGESRRGAAVVSTTDSSLGAWTAANVLGGSTDVLIVEGGNVYVTGAVELWGGEYKGFLNAVDADGTASDWQPMVNGTVSALVLDEANNILYAGGSFTCVGGDGDGTCGEAGESTRNRLAAFDLDTGAATAWDPNIGGNVLSMALDTENNILYIGGSFTTVNNGVTTRNRIAAIDTATGTATDWNPNATSGQVNSMVLDETTLYVGGTFTNIGGSARNRLAALDTTTDTSNATSFDPNVGSTVTVIALDAEENILYAGGAFSAVNNGGAARNRIAAFDTTTATNNVVAGFNPDAGGNVSALALDTANDLVYAGGAFTTIGGQARSRLAELSMADGTANAWDPSVTTTVNTLYFASDVLYVGASIFYANYGANQEYMRLGFAVFGDLSDASPAPSSSGSSVPYVHTPLFAQEITLTSPNGGEEFTPGVNTLIEWRVSTGRADFVNLAWSPDGGMTWQDIVRNQPFGAGAYVWTVPTVPTPTGIVRVEITDYVVVVASDVSDTTFRIAGQQVSEVPPRQGTELPAILADQGISWGSVIRSRDLPTVYLLDERSQSRRPFLDEQTYFTYYDSFASVIYVPKNALTALPLGAPVLPKEGVVLVKVQSNPTVYVLQPNAGDHTRPYARPIVNETQAVVLAGEQWADYVIDLPVTVFPRLLIGETATEIRERSLLKTRKELNAK